MGLAVMNEELKYKLLFTDDLNDILQDNLENKDSFFENIDQNILKDLEIEVEHFWSECKYKPLALVNLMFIKDVIYESDLKYIDYVFNLCDIKLPVKERRKGKKIIFQRFLKNYHRKNVSKTLNYLLTQFLKSDINKCRMIKEEDKAQTFNEIIEKLGILPLLWIFENVLKDDDSIDYIKKNKPDRYVVAMAQIAILYKEVDFESIIKAPEKVKFQPEIELVRLKREEKKMQKQLKKKDQELTELKRELYNSKLEQKKLATEYHELIEMATAEEAKFKTEKDSLQEYYLEVIENLTNQIESAQNEEREENKNSEIDLKGSTIAVIGGSRKRFFQEIIESSNGNIIFVAEDNYNKIKGAVQKANAVFYLKEAVSHDFFRIAYPLAKKNNTPFIYINSLGISTFKKELKKLVS